VRQRLIDKGFENVVIGSSREWMLCSPADVKTALVELQKGLRLTGTHHETFQMRREQEEAVGKTHAYFQSSGGAHPCSPAFCGTRRCASERRLPLIS